MPIHINFKNHAVDYQNEKWYNQGKSWVYFGFYADCIQSQVFKEAATYLQLDVDQFATVSQNGFSNSNLKRV